MGKVVALLPPPQIIILCYIYYKNCIPVGCIPPACLPYLPACTAQGGLPCRGGLPCQGGGGSPCQGVSPCGGGLPCKVGVCCAGGVYLARWVSLPGRGWYLSMLWGRPPLVNRITDACENIALPQLHCGR